MGCSTQQAPGSPSPGSASLTVCEDNAGSWDQTRDVCTRTATNAKHVDITLSAKYPDDLLDNPTAGPPLKDFLREFFTRFGHPDDDLIRNGRAELTYRSFEHTPDARSIVFTNVWDLGGAHPNDEITTFTFDLQNNKLLTLTDLFCDGIDPLAALPPLARPYVEATVGQDINITQDEPGQKYNYADDYRAWYLDGPDLVLVMPAARSGPAHAGQWQPHIPLTQLHSILRDGGCAA
ncbi:hypothetical protein A5784_16360 [Mycobacterium sp. 852013-50091_SCH5140682]|nr:hypothetical protein A5784_16360 [Mycobacterium sp. 852013-50091_SCH5140682]